MAPVCTAGSLHLCCRSLFCDICLLFAIFLALCPPDGYALITYDRDILLNRCFPPMLDWIKAGIWETLPFHVSSLPLAHTVSLSPPCLRSVIGSGANGVGFGFASRLTLNHVLQLIPSPLRGSYDFHPLEIHYPSGCSAIAGFVRSVNKPVRLLQ